MLEKISFRFSYFMLVIIQVIHSSEEILNGLTGRAFHITSRIHEIIPFFPVINPGNDLFAVINILLISLLFIICVFVYTGKRWAFRVALIVGIIEIINGILHISGSIIFWQYFPGSLSAFGLIVLGMIVTLKKPGIEPFKNA